MNENELSNLIIGAAIEVHRTLGGPGLLESVYEEALAWELDRAGLSVQRHQKSCKRTLIYSNDYFRKSFAALPLSGFALKIYE